MSGILDIFGLTSEQLEILYSIESNLTERDIQKNPLPDGLGEAPAYQKSSPHKNSRGRGGRHRYGKPHGKPRGKSKRKNSKEKTNN